MSNNKHSQEYTNYESSTDHEKTASMKVLAGDPKTAIKKLAFPMMLGMLVQTLYNLVDTFWVSGLGADALAAIGFVFPFYFLIIALSNGLGVGGGSAISRRLGLRDKVGADNVAVHTFILLVICSVLFTVPLYIFAEQIFESIGAGRATEMATSYGQVIFAGSILLFFTNVANAILRSEGDSKRAMNALIFGSVLNMVLDPIFIYTLEMGVAGAAWATIVSMGTTSILMAKWLFFKNDTYLEFDFKDFSFDKNILWDIFRVGVPAATQQASMALMMLIMNVIIIVASNTDGVAVYTVGWRIVTIAIAPLVGISTAVVTMSGYSFGEKNYDKLSFSHIYSMKTGIVVQTIIALLTFILAPQLAYIFTMSEDAAHITDELITFLRIICLFYPMISIGMLSSSLFQGIGKGLYSLIATILRALIFVPLITIIFAFALDMGLTGIWWGIVVGNMLGSIIIFVWARYYVMRLMKYGALR
ncbi:MATE family efflux transporter [Methanosalsum natronophilum]|uniref:MATE family efflux transporter n=1 Tax=Methanosalsum natronophilum TaxID=768733 RepID=UPI002168A33B|nr:MATE family efflux transporter [Methanosalsum natronophilum]MCS3923843.1 putative MATE family efflux protein [Methanosalsum natronophilum]